MPRDLAGNYTLPLGNPVVTDTVIESTWANSTMSDVATQLNNVVTRDGKAGPLANVPMGGTKFTGAGVATSPGEFLVYGQDFAIGDLDITGSVSFGPYNTVFELFVSSTGSDSNDGLTPGTAFATLQKAFDTLRNSQYVTGKRIITLAAGTYSSGSNRSARLGPMNENESSPNVDSYTTDGILSTNWITVRGPDVGYDPTTQPWPTPSVIFDGGGAALIGIQLEGPTKVLVKNIKLINYNGSVSAAGIASDGGALRTENVHISNCNHGIVSYNGFLEVRGGDLYGSPSKTGTGIRSFFGTYHSIGNQSAPSAGQGPRLRYLNIGFHAQEGATGHSDAVSYENCTVGILVTVNARVNYTLSDFKYCGVAVKAENNGVVYGWSTASFYFSGIEANTEALVCQTGGVDVDEHTSANGIYATDYIDGPITCTGTSTGYLWRILSKNLKQGRYAPVVNSSRKPIHIEGQAFGRINSTTIGTPQIKFRLASSGAIAGITIPSGTAAADFVIDYSIVFQAYNQQQLHIRMSIHNYPSAQCDIINDSINLNALAWNLELQCELTNTADSITFNSAHLKFVG